MSGRANGVRIGKLVVVGVGLIGGSFALALRARDAVGTIVGIGRSRANLEAARGRRVVDRALSVDEHWQHELRDADLVLMATPVAQFPALFAAIASAVGDRTIVTDAGSTKRDVAEAARAHLGRVLSRFVPGHPIAGAEQSGAAAAAASLFEGRRVVLTPLPETLPVALDEVVTLWRTCGASVVLQDAERHDRVLAVISHLPHLLAYALVGDIAARTDARDCLALAGSGFRDFTRIAASSPEMWRDIALANRDVLAEELVRYRRVLDDCLQALERADGRTLQTLFARAAKTRRALSAEPVASGGCGSDEA